MSSMLQLILITIFTVFFAYLSWRNTVWAISLTVFALPAYLIRFDLFGLPMTILEVMILTLFLVYIIKRFKHKESSFLQKIGLKGTAFSNYKYLMIALLFVVTIAAFVSDNSRSAWGQWKAYFVEPILFFIVFINSIKSKNDFFKVINALGASALIISLFAVFQKFTGAFIFNELWQNEETRRVTSVYGYPNAVGLYLAPITVLFAGKCWLETLDWYLTFKQAKHSWWYQVKVFIKKVFIKQDYTVQLKKVMILFFNFAVIITGSLAIIFAKSEGAIVGLGIGLLFLGLLMKKLQKITLVFLVIAILAVAFVPALNNYVIEKATFSDFSGNLRVIIWQETMQMLGDNGLWGGGLANFQNAITPYHHASHIFEVYLYPHQVILNFWSELGVLGVVVFVLLITKFFRNFSKTKNKDWYAVLIATMIAILVHGLVDVPYLKNDLSVLWWLFFGCSYFLTKHQITGTTD